MNSGGAGKNPTPPFFCIAQPNRYPYYNNPAWLSHCCERQSRVFFMRLDRLRQALCLAQLFQPKAEIINHRPAPPFAGLILQERATVTLYIISRIATFIIDIAMKNP